MMRRAVVNTIDLVSSGSSPDCFAPQLLIAPARHPSCFWSATATASTRTWPRGELRSAGPKAGWQCYRKQARRGNWDDVGGASQNQAFGSVCV